jgi:HEAT repeat protein
MNGKTFAARYRAASALAGLGELGVPHLIVGLTNESPVTREAVAEQIYYLGTNAGPALPYLARALKDSDEEIVSLALYALSELHPSQETVVPALTGCLAYPDAYCRAFSARTLGSYGASATSAVPALLRLLKDPDANVREEAEDALFRIAPGALTNAPPK